MESILLPLALIACPVGMGVMMWFMGRGMMGGKKNDAGAPGLPDLKAEQALLAEKIEALEGRAEVRERAEVR
jgi:hypothetical protein